MLAHLLGVAGAQLEPLAQVVQPVGGVKGLRVQIACLVAVADEDMQAGRPAMLIEGFTQTRSNLRPEGGEKTCCSFYVKKVRGW